MSPLLLQSLTAFFATLLLLAALARIAPHVGLIDKPFGRKRHQGEVPVIGGIAIFLALCLVGLFWSESNQTLITANGNDALLVFIGCGAFLVIAGALDDRFHLGVFVRVFSEILVALAVSEFLDLRIAGLGDLFGSGTLLLDPMLIYPFSVIAIFGTVNAFNMLDGMDGLLPLLVVTTLVIFHFFTGSEPGFVTLAIGASLLAFLVSNLSLSPLVPKTFLGDSGSKLLGFIVACLLLAAASEQVGQIKLIKPATALYVVALPLYDMVFTCLRRMVRKGSPFVADRSHIHHLMQDLGFSDRRALVIIVCIHSSLALIGLVLHRAGTPEYYQLAIFLVCFALYSLLASQFWLVAKRLESQAVAINVQFDGGADSDTSDTAASSGNVSPLRPPGDNLL